MLGEKALKTLNKAPIPFCEAEVAVKGTVDIIVSMPFLRILLSQSTVIN